MNFQEWLDETHFLQRHSFGREPLELGLRGGDEAADWFMMNTLALACEVTEMGDELGWKPWSQPRGWVNRDAVISEIVDQMHFQANILNTLGVTGEELGAVLRTKIAKNAARQAKGDDVRDRRCSGCGRSLDDVGVEFRHRRVGMGDVLFRCCAACGAPTIGTEADG